MQMGLLYCRSKMNRRLFKMDKRTNGKVGVLIRSPGKSLGMCLKCLINKFTFSRDLFSVGSHLLEASGPTPQFTDSKSVAIITNLSQRAN